MRICVFGAGGVGGYIGANLCGHGNHITLVARGKHLDAIRAHGLSVKEDTRKYTVSPDAVVSQSGLNGIYDLVILAVKSYDMEGAIDALRPHVSPDTILLPLANGVEHFDILSRRLEAKTLKGCCYILSHIASPGVIRKKGKVFAAVFGAQSAAVSTVAAIFEKAGLRYKTPEAIDAAVWKKFLFISAFATLTSYYDMGIREVCTTHRDETEALLEEIAAVAEAKGVAIGDEIPKALATAEGLPDGASTSMHLDFKAHKPTELEALSGYIVCEGKRLGVPSPHMQRLYAGLLSRLGHEHELHPAHEEDDQ